MPETNWSSVGDEVVERLVELIRLETVSPPGNEMIAAECLARRLRSEGVEPTVIEWRPGRGNVVARIKGDGTAPPLLLFSHTDVVPADPEHWTHPPFAGDIADGFVWGRGALDMKHMVAMSLLVMALLKRTGAPLKRDVIFAATADEEQGGGGIKDLVANHPDLIRAEWGISEVGGATTEANGKRIYPVQIAEKGVCWVRVRAEGKPGHASLPRGDNAVLRLAHALDRLAKRGLPYHLTRPAAGFIDGMGRAMGGVPGGLIRGLRVPALAPFILSRIPDPGTARMLHAILHNTATPTGLSAGKKVNVIPSSAEAVIDCRTLPGFTTEAVLAELDQALGGGFHFDVILESPPLETSPRTPLFDTIRSTVERHDPGARVIPAVMPAATDAKHLAPLNIKAYGFTPIKMPPGERLVDQFHGHDERVSVDGLKWGTQVLYETVREFATRG